VTRDEFEDAYNRLNIRPNRNQATPVDLFKSLRAGNSSDV